jgi:hypothetical protein
MSNPGFYSDIYQQIRTYADLVDSVLIGLKDDVRAKDPNREKLAEVFDAFTEAEKEDLSLRIVVIMLGGNREINRERWSRLSAALRTVTPDHTLIEELERFAYKLEQQQADALSKMRGWSN